MDSERNIIDEVKKSMKLKTSQGFTKGISSDNISQFLRTLVKEYKDMGRNVKYAWKRMEGTRDGQKKGFSGKHVERVANRKHGKFIIFGKANSSYIRANELRSRMMKQLTSTKSQRKKFEVYGGKAQGQKRADHALSICVGEDGKVYDKSKAASRICMSRFISSHHRWTLSALMVTTLSTTDMITADCPYGFNVVTVGTHLVFMTIV
jgi:hypothetical protein